ncbi:unnamed protein product [Diamesa serratosioi]
MTDSSIYDFKNAKRGVALIFNHKKCNGQNEVRHGTVKDGVDLKNVLEGLQFDVRSYMDLKLDEIKEVLRNVSKEDHSDNDCLWVTVMSHGNKNGEILSANYYYNVQELWKNFLGENCVSLIGKPKLFFIQACGGKMVDLGVLLKSEQFSIQIASDVVDASPTEMVFVIPRLADLLVMYSTAADHFSFRNPEDGSWFIQALCEELRTNSQEDLLRMLTAVNRRGAFANEMPNIVSMLTKTMQFKRNTMKLKGCDGTYLIMDEMESELNEKGMDLEEAHPSKMTDSSIYNFKNAKRGVALIFNHKKNSGQNEDRIGTVKDGDDLKNVLEGLQFDVRSYMDLKLDEIKEVLYNVSKEDHSDNDCLWVTVMTHGKENGKISSADDDYNVQELWENFLGKKCKSLIGKPKLFFIQACRGKMVDRGVFLLQPNQMVSDAFSLQLASDTVDASPTEMVFVIPRLADLLVMYSTAEGHYAFRNSQDGSWFIQAICEELKTNPQDDLMRMLTAVNRRVAFAKQSNVPGNAHWNAAKQMPNIVSMLTKTLYFTPKSMKLKLENA